MKKQVYNPYLPSYEYIPDGEPRVFNERLYIFGSHDRFGAGSFCQNDYVSWSTPVDDLSAWTYHGIIFRKEDDPLNDQGYPLFAPDVIRGNDDRYYLYYAPAGTGSIGVAMSGTPEGRYSFHAHVRYRDGTLLGKKDFDPYPFDPAIFIDDDHRIWLYIGFSPDPSWDFLEREFGTHPLQDGAWLVELEEDMATIKEGPFRLKIEDCPEHGHDFFEAPSMRKIDGRYYFIYSSFNSHELTYAISEDPKGPYHYKGILHDNGDIGLVPEKDRVSYTGNNHGSLMKVKDKWYIFGHRQTNYCAYSRQAIAEEIHMNEDGTFKQAQMTSCGLNGAPLIPQGRYGAYIACHLTAKEGAFHYDGICAEEVKLHHPAFSQDGEDRECDPKQFIRNMYDGSVCGFKWFSYKKDLQIAISSRGDEGHIEVRTKLNGPVLTTISISSHEDFTQSERRSLQIGPCERFALYLTYKGKGRIDLLDFELS